MTMKTTLRRRTEQCQPSCVESEFVINPATTGEVAWFTDDGGNLAGTLTEGNGRKSWGYVILGHDDRGEVLLLDRKTNYRSWQVAELQILLAMHAARKRRLALLVARDHPNPPRGEWRKDL